MERWGEGGERGRGRRWGGREREGDREGREEKEKEGGRVEVRGTRERGEGEGR